MKFNPYLCFDGQCETALQFYASAFGGKIEEFHRFGESPMANDVPAEFHQRVMHAGFRLPDGGMLMASDAMPGQPFVAAQGITLTINLDDVAKAETLFQTLAEGGQVSMPLQSTFWATRFGMVTDRFGTPWMINCDASAEPQ